jgi:hypothetical protein
LSEPFYLKKDREAAEKVARLIALPLPADRHCLGNEGEFDPWGLFPSLYGSYNREFDDLAIGVLCDIRNGVSDGQRDDLAAEMFREMLCTSGLCDYGSSPRVCFPTEHFREMLPALIEKWRAYSQIVWGAHG